jgi:hypothetical protein
MYDSIKKHQPLLQLQGHFPKGEGHNYKYWRSESDSVLNFFLQIGNIE